MNQSALERAVVRATGESRRTIRRYGFSLVPDELPATETTAHLGLDCPGCGAKVAFLHLDSTLPEFAECPRCDAAYPYAAHELYLVETPEEVIAACA